MRFLLAFALCLLGFVANAAYPPFQGFYGTNGILITTNITTGTVLVDGSAISGAGTNQFRLGKSVLVTTNGNDSTGARNNWNLPFLTVNAGQIAAVAGDTVFVGPGQYAATNLGKPGVSFQGLGNPLLTFTNFTNNGPGWGIIDDRWNGATTSSFTGFRFKWNAGLPITNILGVAGGLPTNVMGCVVITNPNSQIYIESPSMNIGVLQPHNQGVAGIHVKNTRRFNSTIATIYDDFLRTNYVAGIDDLGDPVLVGSVAVGYYWESAGEGGCHFTGDLVEGNQYSAWWNAPATTTTGEVFMVMKKLSQRLYISTEGNDFNPNWKSWQTVLEMSDLNILGGGKHYVTVQKLTGNDVTPVVDVSKHGELWLTAQKVSGLGNLFISSSNFVSHVSVQQWEDLGGSDPCIQMDGTARATLYGGEAYLTNRTFLTHVANSLAKITIDGANITSYGAAIPFIINTNGVTLKNVLVRGTNNQFSLGRSSAGSSTVTVINSAFPTGETNTLSIIGGPLTTDAQLTPQ